MADASDEFRIKATIDTSGASAGADQLVGDVNKIGAATGEAGETAKVGGEKLDTAALGNLRSVHHLLTGLMELGQGGTAAIGGLAAEGRVATEVFEGMLGPLAPIALAFTTITMLAVPMIEKWQEHLTKIADAKDSTGDLKAAAASYKDEIDAILESQKLIEQSDKNQLEAIKGMAAAEAELIRVQKDAAIEKARSEYLAKLTPDMPEADRKKAKEQFDATKSDIEGSSEVAAANLALKTKDEEIAQQKKDLADTQAAMKSDQQRLQAAQDAAASGGNFLALNGIKTDDKGNLTAADGSNAAEAQQKKIDETSEALQGLKRQLESEAKLQAEHHDRPDADFQASQQRGVEQIKQLSDQLDQETLHLAELRNAAQAILDYKTARENFSKAIQADSGKIDAQRDALNSAAQELNTLTQAATVAAQKALNDHTEHTDTSEEEAYKKKRDDEEKERAANREIRRLDLQALMDNPRNTTSQKEDLQRRLDAIEQEKLQDEKNTKIATGDVTPGSAQAQVYDAQGREKSAKTRGQVDKEQDKDAAAQAKATQKQEELQIKAATETIEKSGNSAAIGQLQRVIASHLNTLQELPILMKIIADSHLHMEREVSDLSARVGRLFHP